MVTNQYGETVVAYPGNAIPSPGFYVNGASQDDEILYSTARFTQKGITLSPGIGVILRGTPMARNTVTKLWVPWVSGGSNGTGTVSGILRQTVDTGTDTGGKVLQGNIIISGILKLSMISYATATVAAITGARSDAALGTFTF